MVYRMIKVALLVAAIMAAFFMYRTGSDWRTVESNNLLSQTSTTYVGRTPIGSIRHNSPFLFWRTEYEVQIPGVGTMGYHK